MPRITNPAAHSFALHAHCSLRFCSGLFLALAILALNAVQAQTTTYSLGTTNLVVALLSGTNSVALMVTPATGTWAATANTTWLHLNPANQSGIGGTNIVFSYDVNSGATRFGTLTIGDQTLDVTQAGSTYVAAGLVTTLVSGLEPAGVALDPCGQCLLHKLLEQCD